jgi:hypothetical protein
MTQGCIEINDRPRYRLAVATRRVGWRQQAPSQEQPGRLAREFSQPALEEAPFCLPVDELERAFVGCAGVVGAVEPAQEFGAGRVQVVVVLEFEPLGESECGLDVSGFGERGCLVELDDGRAGAACELAVEGCELRPVLGLVEVEGGNGGL